MATARFIRSAGLWLIVGALIQLVSASVQARFPMPPGSAQFVIRNVIVAIAHVPVLIGMVGLSRSGAAGSGWPAKLGLGITLLSSAVLIPAVLIPFELTVLLNIALGELLLGLYAPLIGIGLVLTGMAVLRARRWPGWQRLVPLLCGLYPFLVLMPAFATSGGPNFWAIAGWQIPFVLLGLALHTEARIPQSSQPVVVA